MKILLLLSLLIFLPFIVSANTNVTYVDNMNFTSNVSINFTHVPVIQLLNVTNSTDNILTTNFTWNALNISLIGNISYGLYNVSYLVNYTNITNVTNTIAGGYNSTINIVYMDNFTYFDLSDVMIVSSEKHYVYLLNNFTDVSLQYYGNISISNFTGIYSAKDNLIISFENLSYYNIYNMSFEYNNNFYQKRFFVYNNNSIIPQLLYFDAPFNPMASETFKVRMLLGSQNIITNVSININNSNMITPNKENNNYYSFDLSFNKAGLYPVTISIIDNLGNQNNIQKLFIVRPKGQLFFNIYSGTIAANHTVKLLLYNGQTSNFWITMNNLSSQAYINLIDDNSNKKALYSNQETQIFGSKIWMEIYPINYTNLSFSLYVRPDIQFNMDKTSYDYNFFVGDATLIQNYTGWFGDTAVNCYEDIYTYDCLTSYNKFNFNMDEITIPLSKRSIDLWNNANNLMLAGKDKQISQLSFENTLLFVISLMGVVVIFLYWFLIKKGKITLIPNR